MHGYTGTYIRVCAHEGMARVGMDRIPHHEFMPVATHVRMCSWFVCVTRRNQTGLHARLHTNIHVPLQKLNASEYDLVDWAGVEACLPRGRNVQMHYMHYM
jgi:hypothetical protein